MATFADHRVHLRVETGRGGARARWLVVAMMLVAIGVVASAFFLPWWHFTLYAPQYPHGLHMQIALTGVSGDVSEIDELNHYIGMAKLEGVAPVERHLAPAGVVVLAAITLVATFVAGRKNGWLVAAPALAFPLTFMADTYYWLRCCGHGLDKHAAIRLPPFTPEMFGNGKIGQFLTFASPAEGFWVACFGAALALAATFVRQHAVCARCSRRATCGLVCKIGFVGKENA